MKIVYISGSPRENSNTDFLLKKCNSILGGELIKLSNYDIGFCDSCWACLKTKKCNINDDLTNIILPKVIESDVIFLGTPVYFNNVSGQLKIFMDRTWSVRGKLKNKIGGAVVVGRKYGHQSAINAINSFFLKHEMIPANRGVSAIAFEKRNVELDKEALKSTEKLCKRIIEINKTINI